MIDKTKQYKILIVDDNEINVILADALVKAIISNTNIFIAKNGIEAIESFNENKPDIILMDIQMPILNGFDTTIKIREIENKLNIHTPIIALTAGVMQDEKNQCVKAGMDDFLAKPISIDRVKEILEKYLIENK